MRASTHDSATAGEPDPGNRRVFRDTDNELIGGVAAGLAAYFNVDVVWIRLGFVLATVFANGLGVPMYVAAWIIIPAAPPLAAGVKRPAPVGRTVSERTAKYWLGVGLVTVGALLFLNQVGAPLRTWLELDRFGRLVFPLVLIAVGVAVWQASRKSAVTSPDAAPDTTSFDARVQRFADTVETGLTGLAHRIEAAIKARYAPRPNRQLAPVTFALALITLGVLWLLRSTGLAALSTPRIFATALLIIGVGSLAGAFVGRGRGLIPAGILLSMMVLLASTAAVFPDGTRDAFLGSSPGLYAEEVSVEPARLDALDAAYTFSNGQMLVDLRGIDSAEFAAAGITTLTITMGVGELLVRVPDDVGVAATVALGVGVITVGDTRITGWQAKHEFSQTLRSDTPGDGLLVLRIAQAAGRVTVAR